LFTTPEGISLATARQPKVRILGAAASALASLHGAANSEAVRGTIEDAGLAADAESTTQLRSW